MKKFYAWAVYMSLGVVCALGQQEEKEAVTLPAELLKPHIIERGPDHRVWERITAQTNDEGVVSFSTNTWTDLASGMHYWDKNHWKVSRAEINIVPDGAEASQGAHKVHFAGNINTDGAITITTRDNKKLRAHVVGLGYTDTATGQSAIIAQIRDSVGQLFPLNQVVYPNAFDAVLADVRYTYTRSGFEQDVILLEKPAPPSAYGLNDATTLLEVWTEFVEAPEPVKSVEDRNGLSDEGLSFGKMRMAQGRAFALDASDSRVSATPVGKTWLKANGRSYLIESVQHGAVKTELEKLPALNAALLPKRGNRLALLDKIQVPKAMAALPIRMAFDQKAAKAGPGLVLDYIFYEGDIGDFTFQADTSYLISGSINITGTATFEGGAIIKIATTNNTLVQTYGDVVFNTDQYRPVIFTSQNDATVGEDFTSPGAPMKAYGALSCSLNNHEFQNLRISHAGYGLHSRSMKVRNTQFTDCTMALLIDAATAEVDNVLFYDVGIAFGGYNYTAVGRNVTVNQCTNLSGGEWGGLTNSKLGLTNSLLVNVKSNGLVPLTTNYTVTTTNAIFQTVGAGAHYLADPSPYRDAGTTNIPSALAADLRKRTTYPPLTINPTGLYGVSQTWIPRCGWDTDIPDLGYHYDPLDYAIARILLTNATIQIEPGTAIAVFNPSNSTYYGLKLTNGAKLLSTGRADSKVTVTHYATVQEMANTNWNGPLSSLVSTESSATGSPEFRCRFTDFTVLGGLTTILSSGTNSFPWTGGDLQFHGGIVTNLGSTMAFTNCLFNRTYAKIQPDPVATNYFYNCTFAGGSWIANFGSTNRGRIYDTLFSGTTISADMISSCIGYLSGSNRLTKTNLNDKILASLTFAKGGLGYFYIPTNCALTNAGSRNATNAGLYHYTMTTNNVKETNTVVDIGFHYVALNTGGTPLDYDSDGIPDYWEDTSGNGSLDSGETDWQSASDFGLKVFITRPRSNHSTP